MMFLILCLTLGLLLAQRFKVLIVVPATLLVVIAALAGGIPGAEIVSSKALTGVLGGSILQIGYLLGLGLRSVSFTVRHKRGRYPLPSRASSTQHPAH
jgi:hypothetical protein